VATPAPTSIQTQKKYVWMLFSRTKPAKRYSAGVVLYSLSVDRTWSNKYEHYCFTAYMWIVHGYFVCQLLLCRYVVFHLNYGPTPVAQDMLISRPVCV
jgi:hypothetical protein